MWPVASLGKTLLTIDVSHNALWGNVEGAYALETPDLVELLYGGNRMWGLLEKLHLPQVCC